MAKTLIAAMQERQLPYSQEEVLRALKPLFDQLNMSPQNASIHNNIHLENMRMAQDGRLILDPANGNQMMDLLALDGSLGPWTDVYNLCETIYYMMTCARPTRPQERAQKDNLFSLYDLGMDVTPDFSDAIMKGMSLNYRQRFQSLQELERALYHYEQENDSFAYHEIDSDATLSLKDILEEEDDTYNFEEDLTIAGPNLDNQSTFEGYQWKDYIPLDKDDYESNDFDEKSKLPLILGGVAVFLLLCAIIVTIFLMKRSDKKEADREKEQAEATTEAVVETPSTTEVVTTEAPIIMDTEEEIVAESNPLEHAYAAKAVFYNDMDPVEYNGHAYAVIDYKDVDGLEKSWEQWEYYAESIGGYLAVIDDQAENDFIYQEVVRSQGLKAAMFGCIRNKLTGGWQWTNGSTTTYTNWNQRTKKSKKIYPQPDNGKHEKEKGEDYGEFYFNAADGTWNDAKAGKNTHKFIVEWDR